jgi:hypothetical protein
MPLWTHYLMNFQEIILILTRMHSGFGESCLPPFESDINHVLDAFHMS